MFPLWFHFLFWLIAFGAWIAFALRFKAKRNARSKGIVAAPVEGLPRAEERPSPAFGSPIEKRLFDAMIQAGLPVPEMQHEVHSQGRLVTIPDLAYPAAKIAIFCDGHQWHSTRDQMTRDGQKRNFLQVNGWLVLVFTGTAINRHPASCVEAIRQAIQARR